MMMISVINKRLMVRKIILNQFYPLIQYHMLSESFRTRSHLDSVVHLQDFVHGNQTFKFKVQMNSSLSHRLLE
jgi:hypothetical protein